MWTFRSDDIGATPSQELCALAVRPFLLHARGRWFVRPDGVGVNLRKYAILAALLQRLGEARARAPGVALAPDALIADLWPGQKILRRAARNRLHVAICTLRRLGLAGVLHFTQEGYHLDPGVLFQRAFDADRT
jgi:hypothetical protein